MTTKSLAILLAVLLGGLSGVYFLPQQLGYQPMGVKLELPEYLGEWYGKDLQVSQKERDTLGHDTEFARKSYTNGRGDTITASIVLAGDDMMTGIHRPERCFNAQGWNLGNHSQRKLTVEDWGRLPVTRMCNNKLVAIDEKTAQRVESIAYYWFIGHTEVTASHETRVIQDSRDRLIHGYNQRWAMVTIVAEITKDRYKFGRDEKETDEMVQGFIKLLAPKIHLDSVERPS